MRKVSGLWVAVGTQSEYAVSIKRNLTGQKSCPCKNGDMLLRSKEKQLPKYSGQLLGAGIT